jgi:hypothetical protein
MEKMSLLRATFDFSCADDANNTTIHVFNGLKEQNGI